MVVDQSEQVFNAAAGVASYWTGNAATPCYVSGVLDQVEHVLNEAARMASYFTGNVPRRACISVVVDQVEQVLDAAAGLASYFTGIAATLCVPLRGRGPSGAGVERGCRSGVLFDRQRCHAVLRLRVRGSGGAGAERGCRSGVLFGQVTLPLRRLLRSCSSWFTSLFKSSSL